MAMAKKGSSRRWIERHIADPYVKEAQRAGYRSRAAYKLLEIDGRDKILRPGMTVIDLGAAPGGWSQVAAEHLAGKGRILAVDLLSMEPIAGVDFIQGDFREQEVLDRLMQALGAMDMNGRAGLVMSDMAPNISGISSVDQPRAVYLAEIALDLARRVLAPGGDLLIKVFQGAGTEALYREARKSFGTVVTRKPKSSRPHSREAYLLARNYGM
jgi:23S rRNA (uridine2552-2'-O)-methyltransferase